MRWAHPVNAASVLTLRGGIRAQAVLLTADGLRDDARLDTRREIASKWTEHVFEERLGGVAECPAPAGPIRDPAETRVPVHCEPSTSD